MDTRPAFALMSTGIRKLGTNGCFVAAMHSKRQLGSSVEMGAPKRRPHCCHRDPTSAKPLSMNTPRPLGRQRTRWPACFIPALLPLFASHC